MQNNYRINREVNYRTEVPKETNDSRNGVDNDMYNAVNSIPDYVCLMVMGTFVLGAVCSGFHHEDNHHLRRRHHLRNQEELFKELSFREMPAILK